MPTVIVRASLALGLALVLLAAAGTPARADDTSAAREHYQKGTSFYDLGRYPEAIREFEAAYQIKNDPALLYNLAQSHRLAGNSEQALHFYRTYLRRVPKAANRAEIEGRITQLEQLVAQKNTAQTTPPNVTIPPAEQQPPPPVTTPPPPPVTTTAPPPVVTPPLPEATPQPAPATSMPADDAQASLERGLRLKRYGKIAMIAGGGLFVVGAIVGSRANGAAEETENAARTGGTFDPSVESRGKTYAAVGNTFIILGLLGAAAGGGLYLYGRHQEKAATLTVTPIASASSIGGSMRVTF